MNGYSLSKDKFVFFEVNMKRLSSGIICLILLLSIVPIFPGTLMMRNHIARIGNEIILKKDIERYAKIHYLSYDEAKRALINLTILYNGAMIYSEEPTDEQVNKQVEKDKAYYANMIGKNISELTDEEFLNTLHYNNVTMIQYKKDLKKILWAESFLRSHVKKALVIDYKPEQSEIEKLMKDRPDLFEERGGAVISLIYFSYYDENGNYLDQQGRDKKNNYAQKCLKLLKEGESFELLAMAYSDDLITKHQDEPGKAGFIAFDDPRSSKSFSADIIRTLKNSNIGIIETIFETNNGLYIIRNDKMVEAVKLSADQALIKAESYLKKLHNTRVKSKVKEDLITDISSKINIKIY